MSSHDAVADDLCSDRFEDYPGPVHLTRSGDGAIFFRQDPVLKPGSLRLRRIEYRISNKEYRTAEVFILRYSVFDILRFKVLPRPPNESFNNIVSVINYQQRNLNALITRSCQS